MHHAYFPLSTGNTSYSLFSHYRACVMSTFLLIQGTYHIQFSLIQGMCHDHIPLSIGHFLSLQGMCHVHFSLNTGHTSCTLSSQYKAYIISTLLSVQGTCHVHFCLTTGHVLCPLSFQHREHVKSTSSTGTAILHSLT